MKRTRRGLALLAAAVLSGGLLGTAQASPTYYGDEPFCGQVWGSLPEAEHATASDTVVTDVRAGRHVCFDRLVIDLRGPGTTSGSYDVRYVSQVHADGSGHAVPVRGAADLRIVLDAPAYDADGRATYAPADRREVVDVSGFSTFRQVAWAGSYEGRTTMALGVRARLPFRVFVLDGVPNSGDTPRLVIDVAHRW